MISRTLRGDGRSTDKTISIKKRPTKKVLEPQNSQQGYGSTSENYKTSPRTTK